jgi:flavin-binding protein dodecin
MSNHTYRVIKIIGTSPGIDAAIRNGLARAAETTRGLDWFGVQSVRGHLENRAIAHFHLKISRLPEFIPDERRSGELGFDSGGTVGAVAACRAATPGFTVPGWLLFPWGRLDRGPRVRGWRGRG